MANFPPRQTGKLHEQGEQGKELIGQPTHWGIKFAFEQRSFGAGPGPVVLESPRVEPVRLRGKFRSEGGRSCCLVFRSCSAC